MMFNNAIAKWVGWLCFSALLVMTVSCGKQAVKNPAFVALNSEATGLQFENKLRSAADFNMFRYMYFYNGAGIGAGDFNNDGLIDLYFASNQQSDKLFLNKGKLRFEDVSERASLPRDSAWHTGVSVVDINNDGLLDIYVCCVGNFETLHGRNQLLLCTGIDSSGIPHYKEAAVEYGLDFSGFSTQAAFFDFDADGDLDCFLLNHSVHQQGSFAERSRFVGTYDPLSGDRMFRNDGGHFTDITRSTGINSSAISYGLGIAVSDINLDGYPDIYAGNDFHENDYLYINQRNGTFKEMGTEEMMHTSEFSMGVDVGDINNDAFPDIISLDMLPDDPSILRRSLGEDAYDVFRMKIRSGYSYQFSRNNLQLNRRDGLFSEIGLFASVAATDWSWAPLWMDFDNDGYKDLFISNGIPKRLNDMDYVSYVSSQAVQEKIKSNSIGQQDMELVKQFPEIKLPNRFYKNAGNYHFMDIADSIEGNTPGYSNGAIYADLDNDGDLDIVVNNIDAPVVLYENLCEGSRPASSLQLTLKGPADNRNALGSKLLLYWGDSVSSYEKFPVHGFLSSMEIPLHVGLPVNHPVDSALLIWPDNRYQPVAITNQRFLQISYSDSLPFYDYSRLQHRIKNPKPQIEDITGESGLQYRHIENPFVEFDREPLIPFMVSRDGPALAVGDMNGDGREDIFIGSAKREKAVLYLQNAEGRFKQHIQPDLEADSMYEETDATWADINNDGWMDLLVASGGNEYYGTDSVLSPRVYLNDGRGMLHKVYHAFDSVYLTASTIAPCDFNGDGWIDLFIGGRAVPWAYGDMPSSYLLENDGKGHFKDVTDAVAPALRLAGMVKQAIWCDIDKDGKKELILALEWGGIDAYVQQKNHFEKRALTTRKGWWNCLIPYDADGDGDIDLLCGNLGLNSRLRASEQEPVRLYFSDFDRNGRPEQLLTYYLKGREIPFASKEELEKQIPVIKKKFLYAKDFANATLADLFSQEKLDSARHWSADYFANALLINEGGMRFRLQALPAEAQFSQVKDAVLYRESGNEPAQVLMVGNFYPNNVRMGRYDADFGTMLSYKGQGIFNARSVSGLALRGEIRHIRPLNWKGLPAWILVRNDDSCQLIRPLP